jgi:hypothetical protein
MQSSATTVEEYLSALADDRRAAVSAVREVILRNLPAGYEEGMQFGMISYYVPHSVYPAGYHCNPKQPLPFLSLASQKNHMSLHLISVYMTPGGAEQFADAYRATGKRLDMGKGCVRFRKLEDLPLELVGEVVAGTPVDRLIAVYDEALAGSRSARKK